MADETDTGCHIDGLGHLRQFEEATAGVLVGVKAVELGRMLCFGLWPCESPARSGPSGHRSLWHNQRMRNCGLLVSAARQHGVLPNGEGVCGRLGHKPASGEDGLASLNVLLQGPLRTHCKNESHNKQEQPGAFLTLLVVLLLERERRLKGYRYLNRLT